MLKFIFSLKERGHERSNILSLDIDFDVVFELIIPKVKDFSEVKWIFGL